MFHKTLQRQIKKYLGSEDKVSPEYLPLLNAISDAYSHNDEDRKLIERSLELSSNEMMEKNQNLEQEKSKMEANTKELEQMNKLMVNRELKMIELKQEIVELKKPRPSAASTMHSRGET